MMKNTVYGFNSIIYAMTMILFILACDNKTEETARPTNTPDELQTTSEAQAERKTEYIYSPDGVFRTYTRLGREGYGQDLYLEDESKEQRKIIWSSNRGIEFIWAPDSKHFVIIDHCDPDMSVAMAGLIKKDQDNKICFLKETELEFPVKWELKEWALDQDTVVLTRLKHLDGEPWEETSSIDIKMGTTCIVPELYGQDALAQDSGQITDQ